MAAFELISYAQQLLAPSNPAEVLACAGRAAFSAHGVPAFVAHVVPGRAWQEALLLSVSSATAPPSPAARSALFALYRRLSRSCDSFCLERAPDCAPIFNALLSEGSDHLQVVPLRNREGRLTGMLVTPQPHALSASDVLAQRAQLEVIAALAGPAIEASWRLAAARRDQERMLLFSETADEALWDWNVEGGELWWGGGIEAIFGAAQEPSKKVRWREGWIAPTEALRVIASFELACLGTSSSWSMEYRLRRKDGTLVEVLERAYFLREADGRAYRVIGTLRDISPLKRAFDSEKEARTQAEQASVVKDEFLAMLGHELRNPLAPILSSLELLERRFSPHDPQLGVLRRQARHLVRLVDDLLDVSRISRGKIELVLQPVAIDALVLRAVEMAQPLITQREHHLELEVEELALFADEGRVAQVIQNLLTNAAKYTPPGGELLLSVRPEGEFAVISVRDNGVGISRELLPHVFDMFVQGRQAIDRAGGGLGLGLTIVRNIVSLHGGTIEARSEGAGRGSTFLVRLPLARMPVEAPVERPELPRTELPSQVLIIDDNEDAAVMLGQVLEARGHSVRTVHHPTDALRSFCRAPPDVAIVDIGLPVMDGYQLARRLRELPGGDTALLIAVTGYGQSSDREKAVGAGFDAHLVKPVSPERLEALISSLARRARPSELVTAS